MASNEPEDVKENLDDLVTELNSIVHNLAHVERQIYNIESRYLEETYLTGNVLKGWDVCTNNRNINGKTNKRARKFKEQERQFSNSSITSITTVRGMDSAQK